jgi:Gametolysin peptidase M11
LKSAIRLFVVLSLVGCNGLIEEAEQSATPPPPEGTAASERIAGTLVMAIVGNADGTASHEYFVEDASGAWIRLLFDRRPDLFHEHPQGVVHEGHDGPPVGARVRVTGERDSGGRLQVLTLELMRKPQADVETVGQPLVAASPRKVAVILANFTNNATQPITADAARTMVFNGATSTNAYFIESSFGVRSLVGKQRSDGDVFGWFTITANDSPCDYSAWGTAARAAAQSAGVDLSGYDHIVHYFPKTAACSWSGVGQVPGRYTWINGATARTLAHELGHNFGLHHASSLSCTDGGVRVSMSGTCTFSEYGDPFDVMGGGYRHFSAYQKGRLGWLEAQNMATVTADGTFTVVPIEQKAAGIQSLRVPIDSTRFYYVELRQPFGFDSFSPTSSVVTGVLIHRGTDYALMSRPELVDMVPGTTSFTDAALGVGKTFVDTTAGISITLASLSSAGATVTVDVPGGTPVSPPPPPPPAGAAQNAAYDSSLRAPACAAAGASCDSGAVLINGRGSLGPEPGTPNTINSSCVDGATGAYHVDESVDRIKVVSVDGASLAPGKTVRIEATVWVWGTADDRLDLYYAGNASGPNWTFIGTVAPVAKGLQTLTATYTLPAGSLQAVRANFRYAGAAAPCTTGGYDDHDDLIFAVQ